MIEIRREDFSVDEILSRLRTGRMGAVVTFVGVVRGESAGGEVERMEIQLYDEMARRQLEAIRREAMERFGVEEVAVIHRVGSLKVSDDIMMIAVGAAHRAEAFDACRYVLENIKRRVPIWKKEVTPEGDFWVEGEEP
ncbi:MAG: molybdenum cofactor biosynthesis protein MoaE [Candidatus Bathyarchaeota archaeon]|nr:molybdenum cofactor biosynthesis protein MoaE [Candidatus Bathyarchaeota archaeon]